LEDIVAWRDVLQGLAVRGVTLVISDAPVGLKQAIKVVFRGVA
jgi:transposase-like protein